MNVSKVMTLAGALAAPFTFSAGFMLNEQGVSSLARGNAGRGVVGDNAADIAANPATSALFSGQAVSGVFHYIDPNINVKGTNTNTLTAQESSANADDVAPSEAVPGFYYVLPIDDQFSFGLSLNSFFGMSTDYPSDFGASEGANKTSIKTYYVTPSFAWKINEQFSVGLGLSYIYGKGEIKSIGSETTQQSPAPLTIPKGHPLLDIDGSGSAFGWSLGGIYSISETQRIGLAYRSAVDLDADADVTAADQFEGTGGQKGTGEITFNLPDTLELSYFNQLNEVWAIAAGVQWINWSRFKNLTIDIDADTSRGINGGDYTFKEENWKDSYRFSLGADYRLNSLVNFHAGYTFDKSPVPSSHRTLTIPDANRNWITLGATLDFETAGMVDLAFAYIKGEKVKVKEKFEVAVAPEGTPNRKVQTAEFDGKLTKTDAMVFSVGYSYNF